MRIVLLAFAACTFAQTGCSLLVVNSGTDLAKINSHEEVRTKFGNPIATGSVNGHAFEDFKTHRKIREVEKGIGLGMGYAMTFGLGEIIFFPHQSFLACRRSILGQELRVYFNEEGQVRGMVRDGEAVFGHSPPREAFTPPHIARAASESIR